MFVRSLVRHRRVPLLAGLAVVACVISTSNHGRVVPLNADGLTIQTPVKAHLRDGAIVVFKRGATLNRGTLGGAGMRYSAALTDSEPTHSVQVDSIVGVETFERVVNPGRSLLYMTASGVASTILTGAALVAIFGSCPTIYADSAGTPVLQAESFSNSIAPLLEKRDVDRLHAVVDASGVVRLEVRNEALETHYIDQLELLELRHRTGEMALPVAGGGFVRVTPRGSPASIHDRSKRDLRSVLARADERVFTSDSAFVAAAARGGPADDYIDVVLTAPTGRDSLVVGLHMRSSLLASSLLYDRMLAGQGARALDYVGRDLARVTKVAQLARWYVSTLGLRVSVVERGREHQVARLVDFGPVAWRDIAVLIPATADGDSVHIRLRFLADEFQIDRLFVTANVRRVEPRHLPIARVTGGAGEQRPDAADFLRAADDRRLQTWPGHRFFAEFDADRPTSAEERTFFLASQGYYTEWIRGRWLEPAEGPKPFTPWDEPPAALLRHWLTVKDSLEKRFFVNRVPIV